MAGSVLMILIALGGLKVIKMIGTREANGWLSPDDLDSIGKVRYDFFRTENSENPAFASQIHLYLLKAQLLLIHPLEWISRKKLM